MSSTPEIVAELATAEAELVRAEEALDAALREIVVLPREQKTAISAVVADAFTSLRSARDRVANLRKTVG
jgi:hypothetical protein